MSIEVMKQWLECVERCDAIDGMYSWSDVVDSLRQAIEQAETKHDPVTETAPAIAGDQEASTGVAGGVEREGVAEHQTHPPASARAANTLARLKMFSENIGLGSEGAVAAGGGASEDDYVDDY